MKSILGLFAVLLLCFASCSGSGGGSPPPIATVNTATTSTSRVELEFRSEMDSTSLNATTLTLNEGDSTVPCSVAYAHPMATLTPNSPLKPDTEYIIRLDGSVRRANGEVIGNPQTWRFRTPALRPGVPPQFQSSQPAHNTTVGPVETITLTFDRPMDAASFSQNNVVFSAPNGSAIAGTYSGNGAVLTFTPDNRLIASGLYKIVIQEALLSAEGIAIEAQIDLEFTITNASGTWQLETATGGMSTQPTNVVMDTAANGRAILGFAKQNPGGRQYDVFASIRGTSGSWATPVLLKPTGSLLTSRYPRVAINDQGQAVVAWIQEVSSGHRLYARYFDGSQWSSLNSLDVIYSSNQRVSVHIDKAGIASVLWRGILGTHTLKTSQWDGQRFSTARTLLSGNLNDTAQLSIQNVIADRDGNRIALQRIRTSSIEEKYVAILFKNGTGYHSQTTLFTAQRTTTPTLRYFDMTATGKAMFAASITTRAEVMVYTNYFDGSAWRGSQSFADNDADMNSMRIIMSDAGNAVLARTDRNGTYHAKSRRFDATTQTWGNLQSIGDNNIRSDTSLLLCGNPDESLRIYWFRNTTATGWRALWATYDHKNNTWGQPQAVQNQQLNIHELARNRKRNLKTYDNVHRYGNGHALAQHNGGFRLIRYDGQRGWMEPVEPPNASRYALALDRDGKAYIASVERVTANRVSTYNLNFHRFE